MLCCSRLSTAAVLALLVLLPLPEVRGYGSGAPSSACEDMTPGHGVDPQTSQAPFQVIPGGASVQGVPLSVTLATVSPTGVFKGFFIQARDAESDAIIGNFQADSNKLVSCGSQGQGGITHKDASDKQSVVAQWLPPAGYSGDIVFRATVVQEYTTFWTGITSEKVTVTATSTIAPSTSTIAPSTTTASTLSATPPVASESSATPRRGLLGSFRGRPTTAAPPPPPSTPSSPKRVRIAGSGAPSTIYLGCGLNKGCFGLPDGCTDAQNCDVLFTYVKGDSGYLFEILGNTAPYPGDAYFAGGLSFDDKMGDDSVVACRRHGNEASVVMTFNQGTSNSFLEDSHMGLSAIETSLVDGDLLCRYTRQPYTKVGGLTFDLDNGTFHLEVARGPLKGDGSLDYHDAKLASSQATSLGEFANLTGSSKIFLVLHAAFMVAAWVGAASSGIFIARYFKQTWKNYKACNIDQWFHSHRFFMILTWSLTMVSFGLILWHVQGWTKISADMNPHAYIGIVSIGLCFIQPFMAMFRCAPKHPRRPIFNWLHWGVGNAAQILGITAIFYGLELYGLPRWTWWLMIAFVGAHCVLHIIMSIGECVSDSKAKRQVAGGGMAMSEFNGSRDMLQPPKDHVVDAPGATFRKGMLALYLVIVWLVVAALITVIASDPDKVEEWGHRLH